MMREAGSYLRYQYDLAVYLAGLPQEQRERLPKQQLKLLAISFRTVVQLRTVVSAERVFMALPPRGSRPVSCDKPSLLDLALARQHIGKVRCDVHARRCGGDGVADLRQWLADHVSRGPWLYPEDQIGDAPACALAAEITFARSCFSSCTRNCRTSRPVETG